MNILISDDEMWLHTTTGSYVGRQWVKDLPTTSSITGLWEPYNKGITALVLPDGVRSEDTIIILSVFKLKTHSNQKGDETLADTITLEDITVSPNTAHYVIHSVAPWIANSSFKLIPTHYEYLAIRKERTV